MSLPTHLVSDLAEALGARLEGDGSLRIARAAEPQEAGPEDLALAMAPAYGARLAEGQARVAVLWEGADWQGLGLEAALIIRRPRLAMAQLTAALEPGLALAPGIHPLTDIHPEAVIGAGAAIGAFTSIGPGARVGAGARIAGHVSIGAGAEIGAEALLHPGVRIGHGVRIGARFIAQPNAVIGGDGFSFVTPERSHVEAARSALGQVEESAPQVWMRIHSLGGVEIGDDVEIGSGACIDRGTIRATRIGSGTKIDNLVQVGHNVVIGRDCLLCGQAGIAGSSVLGDRVVLGGQAGVVDNLKIGSNVVAAAGTLILSNVPQGRVMMGAPAVRMEQNVEIYKAQRRLPRLAQSLAELQKTVAKLVDKPRNDSQE